jgi:hypothetical protein
MNEMNRLDIEFGLENELTVLEIIKQHFNDPTIRKVEDEYSIYDFESQEFRFELKTRRCSVNTYPTTMIGTNKLIPNVILLFKFKDGLFYVKYEKEVFDTFRVSKAGRYDRGCPEIKDYIFIPIERLNRINTQQ